MPRVIAPVISRDDEYFWKGVAEDRLLARCCAECARLQHPPTPMCPKCGSVAWDVRELAGAGFVYSWIVSQHPTQFEDAPRVVALIELDEGLRLVGNLAGIEPADVRNGMRVGVEFGEIDGVKLPQFRPVTGGLS
jgi:uncharacterized OB-fold protein